MAQWIVRKGLTRALRRKYIPDLFVECVFVDISILSCVKCADATRSCAGHVACGAFPGRLRQLIVLDHMHS